MRNRPLTAFAALQHSAAMHIRTTTTTTACSITSITTGTSPVRSVLRG